MRKIFGKILGGKQDDEGDYHAEESLEEATVADMVSEVKEDSSEKPIDPTGDSGTPPLMDDSPQIAQELDMAAEDVSDLTRPMRAIIEETAITNQVASPQEVEEVRPSLRVVQRCHVGNVRSRNEDSTYVFNTEAGGQEPMLPFGLFIVADGMGGHQDGHEASRNVSRIVAQHVLERTYLPLLKNSIGQFDGAQEAISDVMLDAVKKANTHVHDTDPEKDSGTTLTAALVLGRRLYVAHVGDSRGYLLIDGKLTQFTSDHSYVQRLIDTGKLTEEEAAVHPKRNMLYKAVGQGGDLEVDAYTKSLPKHGLLVLFSDGLWGLVPDYLIQQILEQDKPLGNIADELVHMALGAGGHDNISVILAEFSL